MPSVFSRILSGELPGRIVFQDDQCAVLLSSAPLRPGHALVVPRQEIDHWLDMPPELHERVFAVARRAGLAMRRAFPCDKVALVIAGIEVRHVHLHLVPIDAVSDLDFAKADRNAAPADLDEAAERLRAELQR